MADRTMQDTKVCSKCGERKSILDFHKTHGNICKSCTAEYYANRRLREKYHQNLTDEQAVWFFWNNCRAAKRYIPRKIIIENKKINPLRIVYCSVCGEKMTSYGSALNINRSGFVCRSCRNENLERLLGNARNDERIKAEISANKFRSELENCEKLGTCDIIRAHHEAFIEDKERLTSEFLIKMICGNEKLEKYKDLGGISL